MIAFLVKILAGITLGILYFSYYKSGDTLVLHQATVSVVHNFGKSLFDFMDFLFGRSNESLVDIHPVLNEPRTAFFVKIMSVFYVLTANNYWITSVYFSFFSFLGSWIIADTIININGRMKVPSLFAFFYFPTFVFWTSGIIKESIAWSCIAILISYTIIFVYNRKFSGIHMIFYLVLLYILWNIKYHYAAVFLLCSAIVIIYNLFLKNSQRSALNYFVVTAIIIVVGILLMISHPNLYPDRILSILLDNHATIIEMSDPGHYIKYIGVKDPYIHFIINIPLALFAGLFMPLLWQGSNILMSATGLVNTILILLFIMKVISFISSGKKLFTIDEILFSIYIVILAIFMAYSTPNFGTLERYKTSYIAFFALWILYDNPIILRIFRYFKH